MFVEFLCESSVTFVFQSFQSPSEFSATAEYSIRESEQSTSKWKWVKTF